MLAKEVFLFIVLFAISITETYNILNNVQLPLQQRAVPLSDEFKDECIKKGGRAAYLKTLEAGNKYFDCFNDYVMHSLNNSHSDCLYGRVIYKYIDVVQNSCSVPIDRRDGLEFYHLVLYSTRTGVFQDFINNTGVECIDAIKDKISACVKKELGTKEGLNQTKKYNKYENVWGMSAMFMYPETCRATNRIKLCTQRAMRDEGYHKCRYMNNVLYVGSLFDYLLERCSRSMPNWTDTSQPMNCSDNAHVTYSLLAALLTVVVLATVYMCFRDCRSSRGPWMVIREQIMKMNHRRTLNEDS